MSTNFFQNAVNRLPSSAPFIAATSQVLGSESSITDAAGQTIHVPNRQVYSKNQSRVELAFGAQTATANALSSGSAVDIIIPQGSYPQVRNVAIELNLTNNTGAACTISPGPLLISYVELSLASGNQLLARITGGHLWFLTSLLLDSQWNVLAPAMGTTNTWNAGLAIANGASANLIIPLLFSPLVQAQYHGGGVLGDTRLRVYFNSGAVEAGAMPTLNSVTARLSCFELPPEETQTIVQHYKQGIHDFKYLQPTISSQIFTLAPSSTYNMQLSGWTGVGSFIAFSVRATPVSGASLRTNYGVASYALLDASGRNIIGGSNISTSPAEASDYWVRCGFPSDQIIYQAFYPIVFCDNVLEVMSRGVQSGSQTSDGKLQLQFTTAAGLAAGSYQIDVYQFEYGLLRIENGNPYIFNS